MRIGFKTCTKCGEEKSVEGFCRDGQKKDGLACSCRQCQAKTSALWRSKNKDRVREAQRKWRKAGPDKVRAANRRKNIHKYGITVKQYEDMRVDQSGECMICGTEPETAALAVDHDHETGVVRGLLCRRCNSGIGYLLDSPRLVRRALEYLEGAV